MLAYASAERLVAGEVLRELVKDHGAPAVAWDALRSLWQATGTRTQVALPPMLLEVENTPLVMMREKALELFESGEFLQAASTYVGVLVRCPTCTKSSFNLAVILHTIGTCSGAFGSLAFVVLTPTACVHGLLFCRRNILCRA